METPSLVESKVANITRPRGRGHYLRGAARLQEVTPLLAESVSSRISSVQQSSVDGSSMAQLEQDAPLIDISEPVAPSEKPAHEAFTQKTTMQLSHYNHGVRGRERMAGGKDSAGQTAAQLTTPSFDVNELDKMFGSSNQPCKPVVPLNEAQAKILALEAELRSYSLSPSSDALVNLIGTGDQSLVANRYYTTARLPTLTGKSFKLTNTNLLTKEVSTAASGSGHQIENLKELSAVAKPKEARVKTREVACGDDTPLPAATSVREKMLDHERELEREEDLAHFEETILCKVCMTHRYNMVVFPCNHLWGCQDCVGSVKECVICRIPIEHALRIINTDDLSAQEKHIVRENMRQMIAAKQLMQF